MSAVNGTRVRVVPWSSAAEFKKVYEHLYSDDINKKKWAYDTISIWETRCHPSLPTAIEATYALTSAVIQDILFTNKASLVHHTDVQALYGSAVTRFVSLIVEVNKNKDTPSYSIAEVAKSIGIPSYVVNLRNEWCHSSRPSLSVLRLAAQTALKYLKDSYWTKEVARVNDLVKQPLDDTKLRALFQEFIQFYEDILASRKDKIIQKDDGTKIINPEYIGLLCKLEKYLKKYKRLFVDVLVSDGIFIPTDEDFQKVAKDDDYALFSSDYLDDEDDDDEDSLMDYERQSYQFETKNFPEVIEYHENLWAPIIGLLNKYDSVPFFMESLLRTQGNRSLVGQKLLIAWILKILRIHSPVTRCFEKSRVLKRIFRAKGIVPKVNWLRMLYAAVENPCKYTLIVLPLIFNNLKIKQSVAHRIIGITAIKLGLVKTEGEGKNFCKLYHTVEELKEALEYQRNNGEKQTSESIGFPCPDDCHKSWPIGHVVNAVKDTDDVEEEMKSIFKSCSEEAGFGERCDEIEDEDQESSKTDEEIDLRAIAREVERRGTVLYRRRSGW